MLPAPRLLVLLTPLALAACSAAQVDRYIAYHPPVDPVPCTAQRQPVTHTITQGDNTVDAAYFRVTFPEGTYQPGEQVTIQPAQNQHGLRIRSRAYPTGQIGIELNRDYCGTVNGRVGFIAGRGIAKDAIVSRRPTRDNARVVWLYQWFTPQELQFDSNFHGFVVLSN